MALPLGERQRMTVMRVPRCLRLSIVSILVLVACGEGAPVALNNMRALQAIHQLEGSNSALPATADRLPSGLQRFAGGLLLGQNRLDASIVTLNRSMTRTSADDRLGLLLLGKAYYQAGRSDLAGISFEKAGLFAEVTQLKTAGGEVGLPPAANGLCDIGCLGSTTLALAQMAERLGDWSRAERYADLASTLGGNSDVSAEALRLKGVVALAHGDYEAVFHDIRQSLDILPALDEADVRFNTLFDAANRFVQGNGCHARPDTVFYSLIALYGPPTFSPSPACVDILVASALSSLSPEQQSFLLLQQARLAQRTGRMAQFTVALARARDHGLGDVWEAVMVRRSDVQQRLFVPRYHLDDGRLVGYDVDPIELNLGLPLDLILFYPRGAAPGSVVVRDHVHDLALYRTINLAPDPGFEFLGREHCSTVDCVLTSFAGDIYGATRASRQVVPDADRMTTPQEPAMPAFVLKLDNATLAVKRSGIASFPRHIEAGKRYLQSARVKAAGGRAYVGRQWNFTGRPSTYDYAVAGFSSSAWKSVNQVVTAPPATISVDLWQLNYDGNGAVFFDDNMFVQVP